MHSSASHDGSGESDAMRSAPQERGSSHQRHHKNHKRAQTHKVTSILRGALFAVWVLATMLSFILDLVADVFQADTPVFPLMPVVGTGIGLEVIATAVTVVYGCIAIRDYHLFQPFAGGQTFVSMQCAGFCLAVVVAVLKVLLLEVHPDVADAHGRRVPAEAVLSRTPYGAFASLGVFSLFSQTLLMTSLRYFKRQGHHVSEHVHPHAAPAQTWQTSLTQRPYRDYLLVLVCDVVVLLCTFLATFQPTFRPVNVVVVGTFTTIKVLLLQLSTAPSIAPSYRLFQPFTPGAPHRIVALQFTADVLLIFFYVDIAVLFRTGAASPPSWHVRCALLGMIVSTLHAVLLRLLQFVWQRFRTLEQKLGSPAASPLQSNLANADVPDVTKVVLSGPSSLYSAVSVAITLLVFSAQAFIDVCGPPATESGRSLRLVIQYLGVVLFMLPPLTYLQGSFLYGKRFSLWESSRGSLDYLTAQVGGWWCYGSAFFCAVLQITQAEMSPSLVLLSAACLLFSQLLIHSALYLFADQVAVSDTEATQPAKPASTVAGRAMPPPPLTCTSDASQAASSPSLQGSDSGSQASPLSVAPHERSVLARVMNAEMLLAMALMLVSLLLRLVYDLVVVFVPLGDTAQTASKSRKVSATTLRRTSLFEHRDGTFYFLRTTPLEQFLNASRWLALVAPLLAHASMRDRVPLLHGTAVANGYVALQTLGWFFYGGLVASTVVRTVAGMPLFTMPWLQERAYTVPTIHLWGRDVAVESTQTMLGLLYCLPFFFFFWSDLVETTFELVRTTVQRQAAKHADDLMSVIARHESSEAVLQQCADSLHMIAGSRLPPRGVGGSRAGSTVLTQEEDAERAALVDAAHYTTILTSFAAVMASAFAFIASDAQPAVTLLLSSAAVLVGIFSCGTLQSLYGTRYHRRSGGFRYFMPFVGGRHFILRQTVGWVSLAICVSVIIACFLERRVSPLAIVILTVTNVLAQGMVCNSIPYFNPDALKDLSGTFFGAYAEAILAVVTLVATFFFIKFYSLATEKRATTQMTALVPLVFSSIAVCLVIPFGLLSLQRQSMAYGLPNPLRYVKQAHGVSPFEGSLSRSGPAGLKDEHDEEEDDDAMDDIDDDDSSAADEGEEADVLARSRRRFSSMDLASPSEVATEAFRRTVSDAVGASSAPTPLLDRWSSSVGPWDLPTASQPGSPMNVPSSSMLARARRHKQRRARRDALWVRAAYVLTGVLAVFVALLIPFGVGFVAYAYAYSALPTLEAAISVLQVLSLVFATLIVFPIFFKSVVERSRFVRNVHSAVCSFCIYSIPTITVVGGLAPGPLFQTRGAWLFTINMVLLAVFSTLPHVLVTSFVFIISSLGYFLHHHFYECLYEHKSPFHPFECATDLAMVGFWLWYSRRYLGRPHLTGRLQSDTLSHFFRRHFFEGMSYYFSLRIIQTEPYVLPEEKGKLGDREVPHRVDLNNPDNQYMFSFHPHGVFPGSALFVPKTTLWEKVMGHNTKNFVSTHCADIVFSVPLMREFPLALGSMSVSRRGIENSLKQGNSPLIVTGGQSDMLLTRMSETEMHLVCHHLGFIRIALHHKVPLVPLLSFSESNIMDNVHCIRVQRWFLKRIGFPFPTMPRGRWNLPLPTCKPLTLVVGQPIYPLPGRDDPTDPSCLDEMRTRYFEHLEVLFYKYRAAAGYPNMKLYLHNGVYNQGVLAVPPRVAGLSPPSDVLKEAQERAASCEGGDTASLHELSAVRRAMAMTSRSKKPRGGAAAVAAPSEKTA